MALGRMYTVDFGVIGQAAAGPLPVACLTTGATNTADVQAIRIGVVGAASFPSNASVLIQLVRATGTAAGGAAATPRPHNASDIAAVSTALTVGPTPTAITGLTQGAVTVWAQEIPFTAGSNWAEWVTPGAEWRVGASTNLAAYMTQSSAGTATTFSLEMVFAE
jgi:hypothetical protein